MQQGSRKQECLLLNTFSLHKTRLIVDKYHEQYSLAVEPQEQSNSNTSQMIANILEIRFTLVLNETLNKCLKEEAILLNIWTKSHKVQLTLSTKQGDYCFEEMNYFMFLNASTNKMEDHVSLQILKADYSFKRTQIGVKIIIHRQGNVFLETIKTKQIVVNFGTKLKRQNLLSQLHNFKYQAKHSNVKINIQPSTIPNKFKFIDKQASSPIGIFNHQNQIYQAMGITINGTIEQIEQKIKLIDGYCSPQMIKQNKLFICHDMKGGYKQDVNFDNNIVPVIKPQNIAYRALHIQQSEIFNYFSHYSITVPPKHWKVLCKKYETKCLGTFITERDDYDQNVLNSREFALFLVAVAKKCKFDGYLINIERKIQNITLFRKWIEYLTVKMHQYIPNSLVIWYDSILPKDGTISYQNGLSRQNYQFYHLTDGIFTNYWWQLENLKLSQELRANNKRKVYIGNDCFGRNTYGGGGFDLYKAANAILQHKNELSIALFAPGFTYQQGGQYNRQVFHLNQMSMYKGIYSQLIVLDKWKQSKKNNYSFGWQKQDDWSVSSFHRNSHCQRSVKMGFPKLQPNQSIKVVFLCQVTSTPPMFESPYKLILQLVDQQNNILKETDVYNFNNFKKSTNEVQLIKQEIDGSYEIIGDKQVGVKIIIMAKSRQSWAGFYGPRFRKECVNFLIYQKQRHWTSKVPINQVIIGSPYHSYCNTGVGDFFFNDGLKVQPFYNFLADMDVPHTHIINHPLETDFSYEYAFCGASSLVVRKQVIKLLKVQIPADIDLKEEYYIQVTVKDTQDIKLVFKYLSKNEEDRIFSAKFFKVEDVNEWKRYTFRLVTNLIQANSIIRSIIQISSMKVPYYLGQIKVIKGKKRQSQLIKGSLSVSKGMVPVTHFFFDLTILSKTYKRLFVIIGKICMFAYFQDGIANLRNIAFKKCQEFQIQIIDTDESLENNILVFKTLNSTSICELIFTGTTAL